ncbi:pirin family protein [Dokdonella sp.]|uniref:pirin family protein n=1 Tax=Dokdonella sp. TaxID=2291710 RepID=UPI00352835D8
MNQTEHQHIEPRLHDLGDGFVVRRMLPSAQRRSVGPFVFLDHVGPVDLAPGKGVDVRPHPHIGLSTMTYLFDGVFTHRDSMGVVQDIRPGAVNWMTAGRGVAHSERTPALERSAGHRLHGVQFWVGLPGGDAEVDPSFSHHSRDQLPEWIEDNDKVRIRLVAGEALDRRSPVPVYSRLFCLDVSLRDGGSLRVPDEFPERAVLVVEGSIELDGSAYEVHDMLVLGSDSPVVVKATGTARVIVLGGDPLDGPRHVWWNFVAASRERIDQAAADWKAGRFDAVPGETEFIPLPDK